jgi:hypothetical protein
MHQLAVLREVAVQRRGSLECVGQGWVVVGWHGVGDGVNGTTANDRAKN